VKLLEGHQFNAVITKPVQELSCDVFISDFEIGSVAIEHAANVTLDPQSRIRASLWHHVYAQAELYDYALKPTAGTWLLHWTTVTANHASYWFPQSARVQTVYIYHDVHFRQVEVRTAIDQQRFSIPMVPASTKRKTPGPPFFFFFFFFLTCTTPFPHGFIILIR